MRRTEKSAVEQPLVRWLDGMGLLHVKLNLTGRRGWPDRLIFIPGGRPLLLELKRAGEVPTRLQIEIHRKLREAGYDVEVKDTAEEAVECVYRHLAAVV